MTNVAQEAVIPKKPEESPRKAPRSSIERRWFIFILQIEPATSIELRQNLAWGLKAGPVFIADVPSCYQMVADKALSCRVKVLLWGPRTSRFNDYLLIVSSFFRHTLVTSRDILANCAFVKHDPFFLCVPLFSAKAQQEFQRQIEEDVLMTALTCVKCLQLWPALTRVCQGVSICILMCIPSIVVSCCF